LRKYTDEEILSITKDDKKLSELDGESFKELIINIHSKLLNISRDNDGFEEQFVGVGFSQGYSGGLMAPNIKIKNETCEKISEALKRIPERKNKAVMLHYLVNELHLFSDGNGRTGRAMLELLLNENVDFNSEVFRHDKNDNATISTWDLSEKYGIKSVNRALNYTSYILSRILAQNGCIDEKLNTPNFIVAGNTADGSSVYIDEAICSNLSQAQIDKINLALIDNTGGNMGISALTMLAMKKSLLQSYEPSSPSDSEFYHEYFNVSKKETFENWGKEDYLLALEIHDKLQEMQLDIMLDIFEQPQKFRLDKNNTIADCLVNNLNQHPRLMREIKSLGNTCEICLEDTRTQQHIIELLNLIGRNHNLETPTDIVMVDELGKQSLKQQENTFGKNEVIQTINYSERTLDSDLTKGEN